MNTDTSPTIAVSRQIAGLVGPTLMAITISEGMNFRIWAANIAPLIYLNGGLLFVAGLSIVRVHNRWTRGWPVLVTLVGWGTLLGGLFRMFFPEAGQIRRKAPLFALLAVLFGAATVLTFEAYGREDSRITTRQRSQTQQ